MYTLKTDSDFDSAHFLKGYDGKCSNIHGHRWTVEIEVFSGELVESGSLRGMIVDFAKLKEDLKKITGRLDHALIIERGSLKEKTLEALLEESFEIIQLDFRPTAENFAKYFYDSMKCLGYSVKRATVYETPKNCASFAE
ncbi:MAG: 6-carboxytetrahydropterin synthase QueD [Clostridium sp.]|nr:6-carboxytetrahydropterin synthase QueD [Clostridium sp.]